MPEGAAAWRSRQGRACERDSHVPQPPWLRRPGLLRAFPARLAGPHVTVPAARQSATQHSGSTVAQHSTAGGTSLSQSLGLAAPCCGWSAQASCMGASVVTVITNTRPRAASSRRLCPPLCVACLLPLCCALELSRDPANGADTAQCSPRERCSAAASHCCCLRLLWQVITKRPVVSGGLQRPPALALRRGPHGCQGGARRCEHAHHS